MYRLSVLSKSMRDFRRQWIEILNIAGPRQSEWPEGYDYAVAVLDKFVRPAG